MIGQEKTSFVSKKLNFGNLGFYIDGWADLAENIGDKAEEVRDLILTSLRNRNMPEVKVEAAKVNTGLTSETRNYTITTTFPGVTTLIRSGQYGKDLLVTWSTYIKPVPNWSVLAVLTVIAAFFGLRGGGGAMDAAGSISSGVLEGLLTTGQMLLAGIFTFILITLGILAAEIAVLGAFGFFILRDPFWVFVVQPSIFDTDDVVSMSLAAHKAILEALDKVGVDIALVRAKQEYQRKRNEKI